MRGSTKSSIRDFTRNIAAGIPDPSNGLQRDSILYDIHGAPLIEILDELTYSTEPVDPEPTPRRKKLGRRGDGYNPLGIEYEEE